MKQKHPFPRDLGLLTNKPLYVTKQKTDHGRHFIFWVSHPCSNPRLLHFFMGDHSDVVCVRPKLKVSSKADINLVIETPKEQA